MKRHIKEIALRRARDVEWPTEPKRMAELSEGRSVTATAASRVNSDGTRIFAGEETRCSIIKSS